MRIYEADGTVVEVPSLTLNQVGTTYLGVRHLATAPAPQDPPRLRRYPPTAEPAVRFTITVLRYGRTGELEAATRSTWTRPELSWAVAKARVVESLHEVPSLLPKSMRDQWAVALLDHHEDDDSLQVWIAHPTVATEADVIEVFECAARLSFRKHRTVSNTPLLDLASERIRQRLRRKFVHDTGIAVQSRSESTDRSHVTIA